ncbi:hypothetical protein U9M48_036548 [Paspalum notatum var. saurae]|uniref:Retrotransposon gag domain-containing protein n=1 Tax=Paspalum notatum var. saurae TaxID=547442 RepID=A0AAQ3UDC7_PASNO
MVRNQPFKGKEDPNHHLKTFLQICNTFNVEGVTDDRIEQDFSHSLSIGKAHPLVGDTTEETSEQPAQSITSIHRQVFLTVEDSSFAQQISTFVRTPPRHSAEAHERFNDYVSRCPHHNFQNWDIIQKFYGGLNAKVRGQVDASSEDQFSASHPPRPKPYSRRLQRMEHGEQIE